MSEPRTRYGAHFPCLGSLSPRLSAQSPGPVSRRPRPRLGSSSCPAETNMVVRIVGLEGEPVLLPFHEESDQSSRSQEQGHTCTGLPAAMLGPGVGDGLDLRVGQFLEGLCGFPVSDLDGLLGQNQVTLDLLHLVPDRDQILDLAERDGLGWDGQGHGQDDGDEGTDCGSHGGFLLCGR